VKEVRAIAACTRLLNREGLSRGDRATYRTNRGAAHLNRGDYDLALEDLNEAVLLDPEDALATYNRGATYFYKNDFEHALTDLKRSAKLDPDHTKTFYYMGRSLHELGRNDEAVTQLTGPPRKMPMTPTFTAFAAIPTSTRETTSALSPTTTRRSVWRRNTARLFVAAASLGLTTTKPTRRSTI
jgi:tetratricopeptide (TPR) repeat protein